MLREKSDVICRTFTEIHKQINKVERRHGRTKRPVRAHINYVTKPGGKRTNPLSNAMDRCRRECPLYHRISYPRRYPLSEPCIPVTVTSTPFLLFHLLYLVLLNVVVPPSFLLFFSTGLKYERKTWTVTRFNDLSVRSIH